MVSAAIFRAAEIVNELPMPAWVFGIVAFVALTALAVVTFSFRDVANRHSEKADRYFREHGGQGAPEHGGGQH